MSLLNIDRARSLKDRINETADPTVGALVAKYGNRLKTDTAAGKINPTTALMAMMTIQRIVAANTQPPSGTTVAQDTGLAPPPQPMGISAMAPQAASQQPPTRMAYGGQVAISNNQVPSPAMERGISGLPVPDNMFDYADGGMIAFAGGGDVQRFQNQGAVNLKDPYNIYRSNVSNFSSSPSSPPPSGGIMDYLASYPKRKEKEAIEKVALINEKLKDPNLPGMARAALVTELNSLQKEVGNIAAPTASVAASKAAPATPIPIGGDEAPASAQVPPSVAQANQPSADDALRTAIQSSNKGPSIKSPNVYSPEQNLAFIRGPQSEFGEERMNPRAMAEEAVSGFATPKTMTVESYFKDQDAADKLAGVDKDFFTKMQGRLDKMRDEAKSNKGEAANLRIIEAGLGILGGTSPYAFVNIGKGASEAVKGFGQDLKEFQKASRELDKAEIDLASAEQSYKRNKSEKALTAVQQNEKDRVAAQNDMARAKATALYSFANLAETKEGREQTARVSALSATNQQEQLRIQAQQLNEARQQRHEDNIRTFGLNVAKAIQDAQIKGTASIDRQIETITKTLSNPLNELIAAGITPTKIQEMRGELIKLQEEKTNRETEIETNMKKQMASTLNNSGFSLVSSRAAPTK
jgi:hypothetical protein